MHAALDVDGGESERVLWHAFLDASFETGFANPIDQAIIRHRSSDLTVYSNGDHHLMIAKGALHNVLDVCTAAEADSGARVEMGGPWARPVRGGCGGYGQGRGGYRAAPAGPEGACARGPLGPGHLRQYPQVRLHGHQRQLRLHVRHGGILLMNLVTDIPETIASDSVDAEMVSIPRRWDVRAIRTFMTRRQFFRSRPGVYLRWATLAVVALTLLLPYTPLAGVFGFTPLPIGFLLSMVLIVALYPAAVEVAKRVFYRHFGQAGGRVAA